MVAKIKGSMSEFAEGRGYSKADWDAVDSPELTDDEMASLKPAKDILPPAFFEGLAAARRGRGRPKKENARAAVTLRLDPDVIETFKASAGDNWRTRMSDILRAAAETIGLPARRRP
jgi:uncharacterized protein (DUF4415 family)